MIAVALVLSLEEDARGERGEEGVRGHRQDDRTEGVRCALSDRHHLWEGEGQNPFWNSLTSSWCVTCPLLRSAFCPMKIDHIRGLTLHPWTIQAGGTALRKMVTHLALPMSQNTVIAIKVGNWVESTRVKPWLESYFLTHFLLNEWSFLESAWVKLDSSQKI